MICDPDRAPCHHVRMVGRVYTPRELADDVVDRTLRGLSGPLTIVDPACGDGAFLRAVARRGEGHRLIGVDIDAAALRKVDLPGADLRCGDALRMDLESVDVVLGNPPWASFSGRHAQPLAERDRRHYLECFETFRGWPALHSLFLERAVRLARRRVGFLLPRQVCDLDGYGAVRALVRRHGRVVEPCPDFGEDAFDGVIQPCCAVIVECGGPTQGGSAAFGQMPAPAGPCMPPEAFADIGVHTGNSAARLLRPDGAPMREGKDLQAFVCGPPGRRLVTNAPRRDGEYFRVGPLERYCAVPILLRQTARQPVATLHTGRTYFRNSVLACHGIPGVPPALVVAWLNSGIVGEFHQATVRESGQRSFPQVKLKHLRALPAPDWGSAPGDLVALAETVCAGRLDLRAALDEAVHAWVRA